MKSGIHKPYLSTHIQKVNRTDRRLAIISHTDEVHAKPQPIDMLLLRISPNPDETLPAARKSLATNKKACNTKEKPRKAEQKIALT